MEKNQRKQQKEFKLNWKNTLVIWLAMVFFAVVIGFRINGDKKHNRDNDNTGFDNSVQLEKDKASEG